MTDPAKRICDELGVSRGEALFYLEGFKWNLELAMEACRSKTLPPLPSLTVESSPGVSVDEGSAPESPVRPPMVINSRRISYQPPNRTEEQPPQSENELIRTFYEVAVGSTVEEARHYLQCSRWNVNRAVELFMDERRPTPSQRKSGFGGSYSQEYSQDDELTIAQWMSQLPNFQIRRPNSRTTTAQSYEQMVQDHSEEVKFGSAMEVDSTESLNEDGGEQFEASSQIQNIQESTSPSQIREENLSPPINVWIDRISDAAGVSREEALFYLEVYKWKFDAAMEACCSKTLPPDEECAEAPPNSPEQLCQMNKEQLIRSFRDVAVGATREDAYHYLESFKWNVDQAVGSFIEGGFSEEETSAALSRSLMENLPFSSIGLPSQSQFQAAYSSQNQGYLKEGGTGSSSSSINANPTETQRSLEEAGEEKVSVPIRRTASSQVEVGKAGEEDSNTKTFPDPFAIQDRTTVGPQISPTMITITIVMADDGSGMSLDIPFRSDQTVRDIRNAIDERTPLDDRDYYLQSTTGVEYRDLNVTVYRISTGGSTTLIQMISDS